jgi:predicted RND superfamily exporter protein
MTMSGQNRKGEKVGWSLGFSGGFLWIVVLGVLFLFQGKTAEGLLGLALSAVGILFVFVFAPWRHPLKAYGFLMIPIYLAVLAGVAWAIQSFGGWAESGLRWWNLLVLFPALTPIIILGARKWIDGERK